MAEKEPKTMREIASGAAKRLRTEVWTRISPQERFRRLREHENGQLIIESALRASGYTLAELLLGRENSTEIPGELLQRIVPGVTSEMVDAALATDRYHGIDLHGSRTQATLTVGAFQNGQVLADNARTIAQFYREGLRESWEGTRNLGIIARDTAREVMETVRARRVNLRDQENQVPINMTAMILRPVI